MVSLSYINKFRNNLGQRIMQRILKNAICDPATGHSIILSYTLNTRGTRTTSIQMIATPIDSTLTASSNGWLEGSNDKTNWINIANLKTDGIGTQFDGGPFEALWDVMRFRLDKTTNCKVDVYLAQREG